MSKLIHPCLPKLFPKRWPNKNRLLFPARIFEVSIGEIGNVGVLLNIQVEIFLTFVHYNTK